MTSISIADYKKTYAKQARVRKVRSKSEPSKGEETLAFQLKALGISFEREFKFCEARRWRADFHLTGKMILIEVEGGIWSGGRHTRAKGYLGDMEKYNEATKLGYKVLRFSTAQVMSGLAIKQIEELVG